MGKYIVTTNHDVYVDDFNTGEGVRVNGYNRCNTVEADNAVSAIEKHFYKLGYPIDMSRAEVGEDGDCYHWSTLVDVENAVPSVLHEELWQEGKFTLYSNNMTITVEEVISVSFSPVKQVVLAFLKEGDRFNIGSTEMFVRVTEKNTHLDGLVMCEIMGLAVTIAYLGTSTLVTVNA